MLFYRRVQATRIGGGAGVEELELAKALLEFVVASGREGSTIG